MMTGLRADCGQALALLHTNPAVLFDGPGSFDEVTGQRCTAWLMGSLLSNVFRTSSIPQTSRSTIRVFRCGSPDASAEDVSLLNTGYSGWSEPSRLDDFEEVHVGYLECWNSQTSEKKLSLRVELDGPKQWNIHTEPGESSWFEQAQSYLPLEVRFETLWAEDPNELPTKWRFEVESSDAAMLIAPQPDMQRWMSVLGSASDKVLVWPHELLTRAEDKSDSTNVPSLLVLPENSHWRFSPSDKIANHGSDCPESVAAQWYARHLRDSKTWALKPNNQCGGSDVWRITLAAPIEDFEQATQLVRRLRTELPCATSREQNLLWSPWITGEPGSLLVLATPNGWWCFPPCRQNLRFEPLPIPPSCRPYVVSIEAIQYQGSEFVPELLTIGLQQLLWDQFAALMEPAERQSLVGWFGIDFVATSPEHATLIEVNPRLTSSYNLHRNWRFAVKR